ncbi:DUF2935 domain-containing protein [Geosporobacter ferrireducens]|uniref:DUF2935 domain-containing protein n=1 Tax=Geosporobacter ferrireducens TaxID=1424294 RepID=A0A1D8GPD1_9FIRM|nr:DUF2935 domain-containing protein [Geosporobacter ferrireducens]AOT72809.1 hypothetical protein Gferi_26570 [Geosporobacter ferrireducens]MTI55206.1 DUF2935 domain-containing protein [Geosporobacter ferrireducens]
MLSSIDFVRQSLEVHLFFARIMKEHSFFLEVGFTPRDANFTQQADDFRREFDSLLGEVVSLSNGIVSPSVLQSGEVITPYTLNAEMASSYYTGVRIATELTQAEALLMGGCLMIANPMLDQRVFLINQRAMCLIAALIQFKATILSNVLSCKMFTVNYPLLIDHIMREAKFYLGIVKRLQNRENINIEKEAMEQELFWNRIMAEHSKFIRGLLDPTENELINTANNFSNEFDQLTAEAMAAIDMTIPLMKVTEDSLNATQRIRDFKEQGTQGLVECKIKSIIIPLLGDHTLREANHYLRLLKIFEK